MEAEVSALLVIIGAVLVPERGTMVCVEAVEAVEMEELEVLISVEEVKEELLLLKDNVVVRTEVNIFVRVILCEKLNIYSNNRKCGETCLRSARDAIRFGCFGLNGFNHAGF